MTFQVVDALRPASSPLFSLYSPFLFHFSNTQQSSLTLPLSPTSASLRRLPHYLPASFIEKAPLKSPKLQNLILFKVRAFILFGFSYFARGFCNLSFVSDILVIMFMGFALMDLFG